MQYKNLERIVNDGYGYYLQSFVDKKDKQEMIYPSTNKKGNANESSRNLNDSLSKDNLHMSNSRPSISIAKSPNNLWVDYSELIIN